MHNDIHNSCQLIYLTVSQWSARKLDKAVTRDLNKEKEASANASRVNKYLMAEADTQLKGIATLANQARALIERRTLPWDAAGNRLVSNLELFSLLGDLGEIEKQFSAAVDAFIAEYPTLMERSIAALGTMADVNDYPNAEQVKAKFSMCTTLSPMPAGYDDVRMGLSPEQVSALNEQYAQQVQDQFEDAQHAAFSRLRENIERVLDRLTPTEDGKNKTFTFTMIDNLRETVALMGGLNVFNSAELAKLRDDIDARLCKYDTTELRSSIMAAAETRQAAQSLIDRMTSMGL